MRQSLIIMTLCVITPLLLSSCWWNKDTTDIVMDPQTQTGENSPYTLEQLETMFAEEAKKTFSVDSGAIDVRDVAGYLMGGPRNIRDMIATLTGSDVTTVEKRAYLRSYLGDYSGALRDRDELCKLDTATCEKSIITIEVASVVDQDGMPITSPNIYLDTEKLDIESSLVQKEAYDNMVHRIRVEKEGYLDAFDEVETVNGALDNVTLSTKLTKAGMMVEVDNQLGGSYTVGTGVTSITYTLLPDTFTAQNGDKIQGKVSVYLFNLDSTSQDLSVFGLDTFSEGGMSLGGNMVTDGMPFVTGYQSGKELLISKDITGIGRLQLNQIYANISGVPKNTWLSNDELISYALPGFWRLDRKSGVWTESKMQILDNDGTYKFLFK